MFSESLSLPRRSFQTARIFDPDWIVARPVQMDSSSVGWGREIGPSLSPGIEIIPGYDRSELIDASIRTLQRDLPQEAIIVSLIIIS